MASLVSTWLDPFTSILSIFCSVVPSPLASAAFGCIRHVCHRKGVVFSTQWKSTYCHGNRIPFFLSIRRRIAIPLASHHFMFSLCFHLKRFIWQDDTALCNWIAVLGEMGLCMSITMARHGIGWPRAQEINELPARSNEGELESSTGLLLNSQQDQK